MYIPKNRIITNLKTNQGEFVYKGTNIPYNGFYWKSYDGKYFTGKNQNDSPITEIEFPIPIYVSDQPSLNSFQLSPLFFSVTDLDDSFDPPFVTNLSPDTAYLSIKNISINKPDIKFLPSQYYPTPTPSDYNLGVFTRYFVVKANENIYLEVNEDTFNNIQNKSADWAWELYTPFSLPWTLTGERDTVFITNRNITQLTEQRLKRRGLQEFLKLNYLKFYKTNEQNIS
jgi:hypothetical protein